MVVQSDGFDLGGALRGSVMALQGNSKQPKASYFVWRNLSRGRACPTQKKPEWRAQALIRNHMTKAVNASGAGINPVRLPSESCNAALESVS